MRMPNTKGKVSSEVLSGKDIHETPHLLHECALFVACCVLGRSRWQHNFNTVAGDEDGDVDKPKADHDRDRDAAGSNAWSCHGLYRGAGAD
ncbi:hypothetical protein GCM10007338_20640 [Corynebacterium pelargi]|nr:hypothetical protein GCM10007338_20640 [Corynebacterium pelargi]